LLIAWFAFAHYFLSEWRLRRSMQNQHRFVDRSRLRAGVQSGTVLIQSAAMNHSRVRVWWTQEDVLALSPTTPVPGSQVRDAFWPEEADESPAFDKWAYERYLDRSNGIALLVWSWVEPRSMKDICDRVQRVFPTSKIVRIDSGWEFCGNIRGDDSKKIR